MGKECNMHIHHKRTFLPMLCSRSSIKDFIDIAHPKRWDQESSSSSSISGDPLSPRVGCMGQVKRNNRVSGLPSISQHKLVITSRNNNNGSNNVKYLKLKKIFSGKNILSGSTTPASTKSSSVSNKGMHVDGKGMQTVKSGGDSLNGVGMSVVDMDPPLPVIKKEPRVGDNVQEGGNLWKRRYGGAGALKTLDLQQLQLSRHSYQQPTIV